MSSPLVVIGDSQFPPGAAEELFAAHGVRVHRAQATNRSKLIDASRGADALIVQWLPVDAGVLQALDRCRIVSRMGIGYDTIDVDTATRLGIAVANTPNYCTEEVAAHTLAMIFGAVRRIVQFDSSVRRGEWSTTNGNALVRPSQTTVAIIGFGRIGRIVASTLAAAQFQVLVSDPFASDETVEAVGATRIGQEEAITAADVLSLHLPLTADTHHLIDADTLAAMRRGSYLVNTCRGGLLDEDALVQAVRSGQLSGAALDVFATEPLPSDSPLRETPGIVLTPHIAWLSKQALADLPLNAAENVIRFLSDLSVESVINPDYSLATRAEHNGETR